MEVIRGFSKPIHPAQILILSWKTPEECLRKSLNGKIPVREYVPKQSHTRLDLQQIDDLVAAYQSGSTIKELTAQFQVHHTTVSNVLERCGVPRRSRPLTPEQIEQAIKTYQAGSSLKVIGDLLGVDGSTISRTLRRAGLEMRDCHERQR